MLFKSKWFQLSIAVAIGILVMLLPRPEGTRFKVSGENIQALAPLLGQTFQIEPGTGAHELILTARNPGEPNGTAVFIASKIGKQRHAFYLNPFHRPGHGFDVHARCGRLRHRDCHHAAVDAGGRY